jgi:hypothetical protein
MVSALEKNDMDVRERSKMLKTKESRINFVQTMQMKRSMRNCRRSEKRSYR